jgi:hypothetical protein
MPVTTIPKMKIKYQIRSIIVVVAIFMCSANLLANDAKSLVERAVPGAAVRVGTYFQLLDAAKNAKLYPLPTPTPTP